MTSAQNQRTRTNCKIIWGSHCEYDLDLDTDWVHYALVVRQDLGDSFGPPLTMTNYYPSEEIASAELDRMLSLWAAQVQRGTPMSKEEKLEIFGGRRGEHKRILNKVIDKREEKQAGSN